MTPTIEAILVLLTFFFIALFGSYIIFKVLKGTALIKRKGVHLGGSAAMFVVIFTLLNKYFPDIRYDLAQEVQAAQTINTLTKEGKVEVDRVTLSPATQLILHRDLQSLDRNIYYVDEKNEFAVHIPDKNHWEINTYDKLQTVGLVDIPALGMGQRALQKMFYDENRPTISGVRQKKAHEIVLTEKSTIQYVPMNYNIFENDKYVKATLKSQQGMMKQMGINILRNEISKEMIKIIKSELSEKLELSIKNQLPLKKNIYNGVYIIPVYKKYLNENTLLRELEGSSTLLDRTLQFLIFSGYLDRGPMQNLYVNNNKNIASFESSVYLGDVEIDGKQMDAILNNIGFIVTGNERAIFVRLIYLSVDNISMFKSLENFLYSLRFTG